MIDRRHFLGAATGGALLTAGALGAGTAIGVASAKTDDLNQPGAEARMLASRVGLWDLTETVWSKPGATPVVTRGLVAERRMIGTALQEVIRPLADTGHRNVARTDLLCYNRLDGRWDYVSFDTRAPVGLMPAYSLARGVPNDIEIVFLPFALPPDGGAGGTMVRMRQKIVADRADHDVKDQFLTLADGTATEWLFHRYDYVRRS